MTVNKDCEEIKKDMGKVKTNIAVVKNDITHIKGTLVRIEKTINGTTKEVKENTTFRNQMIGKITLLTLAIGTFVTVVLNWLFRQIEL